MNDESEFMAKLMEETIAENNVSSRSEPLSHNDVLNLHDKLFKAYPIKVYTSYMRLSFEHGPPIDIPRGMGLFHNEEHIFGHWNDYPTFEMEIVDDTFKEVISNHLFLKIDKAIIFKNEAMSYIVFYDAEYEQRVWDHVHDLLPKKYQKSA